MTDSSIVFLVPTVSIQAIFIFLAYELVGPATFSRPLWVLFAGLFFMALAALSKAALAPLAAVSHPIFSSIPSAITVIEVSTAAIGGSLVAAAFMLKAQLLHNRWKIRTAEDQADLRERLDYINEAIAHLQTQCSSMESEEFEEKYESLRRRRSERRKELERLSDDYEKRSII